eukprot:scaffold22772_cov130-Cylindrotheca_fusiformis.AAC.2
MLKELGLESCADTYVGGALLKGISGGERKRTSIGVELVVKPSMVFLDEPTSGLDSFSAMQVCQVLQKVARAGSSVLFTIHQPASDIYNEFDQLILMNKGRVMYQGSVDDVAEYFGARGKPLPPKNNPADWIMFVAQSVPIDQLNQLGFFPADERNLPDPGTEIFIDGKDESGNTYGDGLADIDSRGASVLTQLRLLYTRELRNIRRDKGAIGARFGISIIMSLLVGIIFHNVGETDSAVSLVTLGSMFGTAMPTLLAFPEERPVFLREYSTNHYSVLSYFLSRFTMEAVITALQSLVQANFGMFYITVYMLAMASTALAVMLGSAVEDPKLGQELVPLLFVPQLLFAGFFVVPNLIPIWLRWARYLCSLFYAVRILLVLEFGDGCGSPEGNKACDRLIESVGASEDEIWWSWVILVALFVVFRLLALIILSRKALKFF